MTLGRTTQVSRLIIAALRPLTGDSGTGTATVTAVSDDVSVCKGTYCFPVPTSEAGYGAVDDHRVLVTTEDVIATSAGKSVAVRSLLGGVQHNALKSGTDLIWDPRSPLLARGSLSSDISGATDPADYPWAVKTIVTFETVSPGSIAKDLFSARLQGAIPAIVVTWDSSLPGSLKGRNANHRPDQWTIFVVVDNSQSENSRRNDGVEILDVVEAMLSDRGFVNGEAFSLPPAVVTGRRRVGTTETSLVYALTLQTLNAVKTIDLRVDDVDGMTSEAFGALWETTLYTLLTTDDPPLPVVLGAIYAMDPGEFTTEFSEEFS